MKSNEIQPFTSKLLTNEKAAQNQNQNESQMQVPSALPNISRMNKENLKTPIQINTRALTLKQMKDTIEEIYLSKQKTDKKYKEMRIPRETLEQHMYTFLNQKYGLKNLIIEWAGSLISGIKNYAQEDNDVAVFGKMLKNECDEEFIFVQSQIKNTILELFKVKYTQGC